MIPHFNTKKNQKTIIHPSVPFQQRLQQGRHVLPQRLHRLELSWAALQPQRSDVADEAQALAGAGESSLDGPVLWEFLGIRWFMVYGTLLESVIMNYVGLWDFVFVVVDVAVAVDVAVVVVVFGWRSCSHYKAVIFFRDLLGFLWGDHGSSMREYDA